jgi:AmmeMemoRadiSam system protein B
VPPFSTSAATALDSGSEPTGRDRPRIRPGIAAGRDSRDPHVIVLYDELQISRRLVRVSPREFTWLQWLDGAHSLREVQALAMRGLSGELLPIGELLGLVSRLEEAVFLDGARFDQVISGPVREPACIGCYEGDADRLREQLSGYLSLTGDRATNEGSSTLRALLVPHIDFGRGHLTYAWGYRDLPQLTEASLYVIVGTSHYSGERYTLTRQDFRTPLGVAPVDQKFVDHIVEHFGDGLFEDPVAHIPEHSIELEVVWLQYLFGDVRPIRIVPLLVGSFHDCILMGGDPAHVPEMSRMAEALRRAEAAAGEPVCYIISGDLAHVGPKFGDSEPLTERFLDHCRVGDDAIVHANERADAAAYFRMIARERDERRICGFPPTWTVLQAAQPTSGRLLHYGRYVEPSGFESVSFASMAYFS